MKRFDILRASVIALALTSLAGTGYSAPADTAANSGQHAAAPTGVNKAPSTPNNPAGDMGTQEIKGKNRANLQVGKFDPPAAFNLEDIQNFPEDRLQPVLNNALTFEEGRDFSAMMNFQDDQLYHPWLAELSKSPFLVMKASIDHPAKDWTFTIIDQAGSTVAKQEGSGSPPSELTWNGEDKVRDHVAVDTVYIPQLATTDKAGYHHTYMGQPIQFSSIVFKDQNKTVIELSSKHLFQEKKSELSKEAPTLLDKVCDAIREGSHVPFTIQPYENDSDLARQRQQVLVKYFSEKLFVPENQILQANPGPAEKRGAAMAIVASGGSGS